mmetsp:Transcript_24414/g.76596  ORF Transcript_24414/g.76596 Transcript_24414/m.76596 type:complete len:86 (+) Transcript_24414:264-521(+)
MRRAVCEGHCRICWGTRHIFFDVWPRPEPFLPFLLLGLFRCAAEEVFEHERPGDGPTCHHRLLAMISLIHCGAFTLCMTGGMVCT